MSLQNLSSKPLSKPSTRWLLGLIAAASVVTSGIVYYGISQFNQSTPSTESTESQTTVIQNVVALGRLEPRTEVIRVSVPAALSNDRIAQLLVQRGDHVKAGQVIAVLKSRDRLASALAEAQKQVSVAQAELAQVRAGAKSGEVAAQEAEIARLQEELRGEGAAQRAAITRLEAEANTARATYNRYLSLYQEGAIAANELDQRRLTLETAQAQLNEARANQNRTAETLREQIRQARATLDRIAEVRPVDVQIAQANVERAIAAVNTAQTELDQASITAPITGQVLEIYAQPGEVVGENGIVSLGQTQQMQVVAEVYQSDIDRIQVGQEASVTGEAFSGELSGTVHEVGLQVDQQEVFSNQPGENLDQRVIKVRIRLNPNDSERVAGLTNSQVQVEIVGTQTSVAPSIRMRASAMVPHEKLWRFKC